MADKKKIKELLAVALKYEEGFEDAPRITAKGKDYVAEQMIAIAEEQGITIHEDKDLVEILSVLDLDSYIPIEAYVVVADILSYVYKTNARKSGGDV